MPAHVASTSHSLTLAFAPQKGMVRLCRSGCFHVTLGCITLDLHSREAFDRLCDVVLTHDAPGPVQLRHGCACLWFPEEEFEALRFLLSDGLEELRRIDVVSRLVGADGSWGRN